MEPRTQLDLARKTMLFTRPNTKTLKESKEDFSQQLLKTHLVVELTMVQPCFRQFMSQYNKRVLEKGISRQEASQ
tara:strand:- start:181 stop:405 length:225 start_codon:yes stop_codon:yes gene_type:complete